MSNIILLRGLPASGKSTWTKEIIQKTPGLWKRVNKDLLREMIDCGQWSNKNERQIIEARNCLINHFVSKNYNVIVDDTNLSDSHEKAIRKIAEIHSARLEVKLFDVPMEECIERDSKREKPVGRRVIEGMAKQYNLGLPKPQERLYMGERPAILCDIDGTLAIMNNRGPYEWDRVDTDLPNVPVLKLVTALQNALPIIFFSGRDESCREKTEQWLLRHGIVLNGGLFMRPAGDMRKDSIVKRELYDNHIRGKFYIEFVLDDRNQVVDMWRKELNLPCFQVAEGNF